MNTPSFKLSANSSFILDLIRLLAAEMVVIGHGIWDFNLFNKLPFALPFQDLAVLIFFILSGFLISYTVHNKMKEKFYSFKEYVIDRFSRIYSAYLPCLVLIFAIDFFAKKMVNIELSENNFNFKTFFANVLMLQDYPIFIHIKQYLMLPKTSFWYISVFGSGRPLWSIAVEWWLYLFYGWFILGSSSKKLNYFLVLSLLAIVPVYNILFGLKTSGLTMVWFMGCVITLTLQHNYKFIKIKSGILALMFFILGMSSSFIFHSGYNLLTAVIFVFSLYFAILHFNEKPLKINKSIVEATKFGASFSFTLYLIHFSFINIFKLPNWNLSIYTSFLLYFLVSNIVSMSVAYFTEFKHRELAKYIKTKLI